MARITVEDCLVKENNRFALVQLAAKRTKQLLGGSKVLLTDNRSNKAVVTALREIAAGQVRFLTEEEKRAQEEKLARERAESAARAEAARSAAVVVAAPVIADSGDTDSVGAPADNNGDASSNGAH